MIGADHAFWSALAEALAPAGVRGPLRRPRPVGGGCIHDAARVTTAGGRDLFVKHNTPDCAAMFAAEAAGLEALRAAGGVRAPAPIGHGTAGGRAWLALEYVDLGAGDGDAARFGRGLAHQHACRAHAFGWSRDNHIGTTPQPNAWHDDWVTFWRQCRLGHQLRLAAADGAGDLAERGWRLAERIDTLFTGYAPAPSLLHGDLWAGNWAFDARGEAVVFDPAVYYGDREADLAMTELFGRFPRGFYRGYTEAWPVDPGYPARRALYNLYHVLNHAHLFGGPYRGQARRTIEQLLAETGG